MQRMTRGMLVVLVGLALVAGGCKKDKDQAGKAGTGAQAQAEAPAEVTAPKELFAHLGLRSPDKVVGDALAVVGKFAPMMLSKTAVLDMLAQRAMLPREALATLDLTGNVWMAALDDQGLGETEPYVMALPLKDEAQFNKSMALKFGKDAEKSKNAGGLTHYKPKAGAVGVVPMWLRVENKHALLASGPKAYKVAGAYVKSVLLPKTPKHDATLHLHMANIMRAKGEDLDRGIQGALKEVRRNMERQQPGVGDKGMGEATEKTLDRYARLLKSAEHVVVGLDVDQERISLSLSGQGKEDGALHKLIKQQRTGGPLLTTRFPDDAWLVVTDHGNPEAVAEGRKTWKPAVEEVFAGMDETRHKTLVAAMERLGEVYTGDYTMALHRAPSGTGLTLSAVSAVTDGEKASKLSDELVSLMGDWIKAEMKKKGEEVPKDLVFERRALEHKGTKGTVLALSMPTPPGKEEGMAMVKSLVGMPLTLGWAFQDRYLLMAMGKETEAQLKRMIEGPAKGRSLEKKPDFEKLVNSGNNRVGFVYLSLLDLARWFKGTKVADMAPMLSLLEGKEAQESPFVDWGVDPERTTLDVGLQIPVSHLLLFKPVIDKVMKEGFPAEKAFGGAQWKNL